MSENRSVLSSATYQAWRRRILLQLEKEKLGSYADLDEPPNEATTSLTVINYKAARAIILASVDDEAIALTQLDDSPKKILEIFKQNFSKPSDQSNLDLNNRPISRAAVSQNGGSIVFHKKVINEEERPAGHVPRGNALSDVVLSQGSGSKIEFKDEVKSVTKIISTATTSVPAQQPNDDRTLQEDGKIKDYFKKVFKSKNPNEDEINKNKVCFNVHGTRLYVDKDILARKAPVIAIMVPIGTNECEIPKTDLRAPKPDIFKAMLQFIEEGKLSNHTMNKHAKDLFVASKAYELNDLKGESEKFLISTLQSSNSLELLIWSADNDAKELLEQVSKYRKFGATQVQVAVVSNNPTTAITTNLLDGKNLDGVILAINSNVITKDIKTERIGPAEEVQSANSIRDSILSLDGSKIDAQGWHSKRTNSVVEPITSGKQPDQNEEKEPNHENITFLVKGNRFPIKRDILAQKAPDFEANYRNGNEFTIENVEPGVFEAMLNYLASGSVKFQPEDVINLLLVADDFKASIFKESVFKYINIERPDIEDTDEFDAVLDRTKLSKEFLKSKRARN